ncbi:hypothetical protein GR984_004681 [Salmonella enterica]|nr:hypothetical protein [Salmonella enterica]CAD5571629.1 Uncharacterised protein [Escherichia coli]CAD5571844.1 Uncharacterised protein [Escherichia coli]CAD5882222.1 Uncharacterised protein [Escherichia coli]
MESIHTDKPTYYVCAQRLTQFEKISHQFTFFWMRKFAVLTCSLFKTSETDRASLSCIVMQAPENDSDAFFRFSLVFPCLFAFFASESD